MRKKQLSLMIQLAISDNKLVEREERLIYEIGKLHGISETEIKKLIKSPEPIEPIELIKPTEPMEPIEVIKPISSEPLSKRVVRGGIWVFGLRITSRGSGFIRTVILA